MSRSASARPRPWRSKILFGVFQIVLALVLLEAGLRLARPRHDGLKTLLYSPTVATEYDRVESTEELLETTLLGFHPHVPNEGFVRNSRGFRTPEYTWRATAGTRRIVVLGDSFTYSSSMVPYSRMWTTELGRRLGEDVEVVNLGVPSIGPRFQLRLWELEGARLDPDLVVLAFFVGNDFTDEFGRPLVPTPDDFWARHSLTYRLIRNGRRLWQRRDLLDRIPEPSPAEIEAHPDGGPRGGYELPSYPATYDPEAGFYRDEDEFLRVERDRLMLCARPHRAQFEEFFAATEAVLVRLNRQVRQRGSRLVVLIIPDEFQVDPALYERLLQRFDIRRDQIELDYPQQRLAELFEGEGIPYYDALPNLRRGTRERRLYKPLDTHWNADGNRFVGRRLAAFVEENHLLPPERP